MNKPRYTLVPSHRHEGETVWAKVLITGHSITSSTCDGCSFKGQHQCLATPPCVADRRPDGANVIFVTEVEKW